MLCMCKKNKNKKLLITKKNNDLNLGPLLLWLLFIYVLLYFILLLFFIIFLREILGFVA